MRVVRLELVRVPTNSIMSGLRFGPSRKHPRLQIRRGGAAMSNSSRKAWERARFPTPGSLIVSSHQYPNKKNFASRRAQPSKLFQELIPSRHVVVTPTKPRASNAPAIKRPGQFRAPANQNPRARFTVPAYRHSTKSVPRVPGEWVRQSAPRVYDID